MKKDIKAFSFCGFIVFFLAIMVINYADNGIESYIATIKFRENERKNKIITKIPLMDVEEGPLHVTGAVLVYKGEIYPLTEEEYLVLFGNENNPNNQFIEKVLSQRETEIVGTK